MATLTADRHRAQRSLLDPHEEDRRPRQPLPRVPAQRRTTATPRVADRFHAAPSGPTLDDLVAGTWDALTSTHAAACPVCGGDLAPRYSSGAHPVAATCRTCGSQLS